MAKIRIFQTGTTLVSPAVPDRSTRKSSIAYTGLFQRRKNRIEIPVKAFYVEVNGHRILIDTGWGTDAATQPLKHMGFGHWFASEPLVKESETVINRLNNLGISPRDLDAVILTHLDCDHVSGLIDVKGAKHIYASEQEIAVSKTKDVRYRKNYWKGVNIEPLKMIDDANAPFGKSCDLFGDGSVTAVLTPGHSAGSVCVVVNDNDHFAVISGDTGYNRHSWEEIKLPGPMFSKEDVITSLQWVKAQSEKENCAAILAAHDPEITDTEINI